MDNFKDKLLKFFTKRNTFKIVVIELIVMGLLLCALLAMSVDVHVRLNGSKTITIQVGTAFSDPGATASADGHTLKVKVSGEVDTDVAGTYTLCYKARYLFSTGKIYRTVKVVADDGPSITLVDGETITVSMGDTFEEPGYTAKDNLGKSLTDQVEVSGTVDTRNVGTYTLTYTVTDEEGCTTTEERTVEVVAAKQPETVQPDGKVIYLTFDDGPGKYTQQLLDVLNKYNVKATFFVVNTSYSGKTDMMKKIVENGHAIGIHSATHQESIYQSEEAFLDDLYQMQQIIQDVTGVKTTLMRFVGGSSNTTSRKYCEGIMTKLTQKVTELGFQYFDWNVDSNDAGGAKTADAVYENVISGIGSKNTAVVLQHDIKEYSVEAVERIIQWGLANGYSFQALTPESPACHHPVNN